MAPASLFVLAPATSPFFLHITHTHTEAKPLPASLAEELVSQCSPQAEDKRIYEQADKRSVRTSLALLLKMLKHLQTIAFTVSFQLCLRAQISWSLRIHLS